QSGQVHWVPGPGQAGDYLATFTVSDGELVTNQTILIRAAFSAPVPNVILSVTPSFPAVPGQHVQIHVAAKSLADITTLHLTVDGQPVTLDPQGRASFVPSMPGRVQLDASATNADGFVGHASQVLRVRDPNDTQAPVVAFDPLLNGSRIQSATNLVGTVEDTNLDRWTLERAPLGYGSFVTLASGTTPIDAATLTTFDPATLANGFYRLRLT